MSIALFCVSCPEGATNAKQSGNLYLEIIGGKSYRFVNIAKAKIKQKMIAF